ncbi:hypothetical protein [Hymenobacter guriensis]|uniref:DUF7847 domain-containing protein n=1 Tax=Hymenobacter guriensis TaxID=2793065 RepID=A0ABS0L5I2_9BACT|nr:hypothetical protein [Hymenobacter guriensis]MBG8555378.1 hypothetical protein [Hymenobacter guriensis]
MKTPFTSKADFCQERDFGQKISATFEFLAAHARPLGKCLLYFVLPVALLGGVAQGLAQQDALRLVDAAANGDASSLARYSYFNIQQLLATFLLALSHSMLMCTVYSYVRLRIIQPADQEIAPAQVWQQVKSYLLPMLAASFIIGIIVGLGMLLFVIPGIYLAVGLSLTWTILVMEDRGITESFSRSLHLVKGKWWSTLGLLVIMYLIVLILSAIFGIPNTLLVTSKALRLKLLEAPVLMLALSLLTAYPECVSVCARGGGRDVSVLQPGRAQGRPRPALPYQRPGVAACARSPQPPLPPRRRRRVLTPRTASSFLPCISHYENNLYPRRRLPAGA